MSYPRIITFLLALQCCMLSPLWSMQQKYRPKQFMPILEIQKCAQENMQAFLLEREGRSYSLLECAAKSLQKLEGTFENAAKNTLGKWESQYENNVFPALIAAYHGQLLQYSFCLLLDHAQKEINFSCDLAKGIITLDLKTILSGNPYAAQQAYEKLQDKWPWKHAHTGFAAAHYSQREIEYVKNIGIDVMREAEKIFFSRPDILHKHGYTIEDNYVKTLHHLASTQPESLYQIKQEVEKRLIQPVGKYTADERFTYQAHLAHINAILPDPYQQEYAIIQSGSLPDARAALELTHINLVTQLENTGITNKTNADTYWRKTYGHNLFETAQNIFKNRSDCPDTDKKNIKFDNELLPRFCALKTLNYIDACAIFVELEDHAYEYAGTRDLEAARHACIDARGYDVFAVACSVMESRSDHDPAVLKSLPPLQKAAPINVRSDIAQALHTSYDYHTYVHQLSDTVRYVLERAQQIQHPINPDIIAVLHDSLNTLNTTADLSELVMCTTMVDILLSNLEVQMQKIETGKTLSVYRDPAMLIVALKQFLININDHLHLTDQIESIVSLAQLTYDITVGKLYLSDNVYEQKIKQFVTELSVYIDKHPAVRTARLVHYVIAQVRESGFAGTKDFLDQITSLETVHIHVSTAVCALKEALNECLSQKPFSVSNAGLIVSHAAPLSLQDRSQSREIIASTESLAVTQVLNEGFIAGTQVKTRKGLKEIQDLSVGDKVCGYDHTGVSYERAVTAIYTKIVPETIVLHMGFYNIHTAPCQKFYQPDTETWIQARNIQPGMQFMQGHNTRVTINDVSTRNVPITIYAITVDDHEFAVTDAGIVVHNFDSFIPPNLLVETAITAAREYSSSILSPSTIPMLFVAGIQGCQVLYEKYSSTAKEKSRLAEIDLESNAKAAYKNFSKEQLTHNPLYCLSYNDPDVTPFSPAVMTDMKRIVTDYRYGLIEEIFYKELLLARPYWQPDQKLASLNFDKIRAVVDASSDPDYVRIKHNVDTLMKYHTSNESLIKQLAQKYHLTADQEIFYKAVALQWAEGFAQKIDKEFKEIQKQKEFKSEQPITISSVADIITDLQTATTDWHERRIDKPFYNYLVRLRSDWVPGKKPNTINLDEIRAFTRTSSDPEYKDISHRLERLITNYHLKNGGIARRHQHLNNLTATQQEFYIFANGQQFYDDCCLVVKEFEQIKARIKAESVQSPSPAQTVHQSIAVDPNLTSKNPPGCGGLTDKQREEFNPSPGCSPPVLEQPTMHITPVYEEKDKVTTHITPIPEQKIADTIGCQLLPPSVSIRDAILFMSEDSVLEVGFVKTIEEILKDTVPGRKTSTEESIQFEKVNDYEIALKNFEKLRPYLADIKVYPNGTIAGYLPDGRVVNVRPDSTYEKIPGSSEKVPTLEIYNPTTKRSIKIRYIG